MKRLFFLFALSVFSGANGQVPRHLDPEVVSIGKELPRGDVVSHDSRADAIRGGYGASKYLQPLTGWTTSETSEAVTYKTRYKIPFDWIDREQFLYLGRVSASFDVVVNGALAGYSQTGSTPSEFDITKVSREGANELEIVIYKEPVARKLENSRPAAPPRIEGEAFILSQPRMRVRDVVVSTRMEGTSGLLELGVIMKSHQLNVKDYTVYYELLSPRGEILAEGHKEATLDMQREDTVRFFANIPRIVPWSHEEPRLYTLSIKTQNEGRFKEYLAFRVGFRSLDVQDGIIRLNNVPLPLTMRDFTPPATIDQAWEQIRTLRAEGVNALRLRGAPPSREFYALCDEVGIYLCGEADIDTRLSGDSRERGGNPSNQPEWEGAYLDRTLSMYHTSKNSPSMVMFSLAANSANGNNLYESYLALKAIERHRPILYAEGGEWNTDRLEGGITAQVAEPAGGEADVSSGGLPDGQWATITARDLADGRFRVHNTRRFTPIIGEAAYKIVVGRKTVSQGTIPLEVVAGAEKEFVIPIAGVAEGKKYMVQVEVRVEAPGEKYAPLEGEGEGRRKVFRDPKATLAEENTIVIGSGDFPSERAFSAAPAIPSPSR